MNSRQSVKANVCYWDDFSVILRCIARWISTKCSDWAVLMLGIHTGSEPCWDALLGALFWSLDNLSFSFSSRFKFHRPILEVQSCWNFLLMLEDFLHRLNFSFWVCMCAHECTNAARWSNDCFSLIPYLLTYVLALFLYAVEHFISCIKILLFYTESLDSNTNKSLCLDMMIPKHFSFHRQYALRVYIRTKKM